MKGEIAIFVGVATLAALAASSGKGLFVFFWTLLFSTGVLLAGALPFYTIEKIAEIQGSGAPFVFLVWIILGPPLSFIVLPAAYGASSWLKLGRKRKLYLVPVIVTGLVTIAIFALSVFTNGQFQFGTLSLSIPAIAVVYAVWIPYCLAMDWVRRP